MSVLSSPVLPSLTNTSYRVVFALLIINKAGGLIYTRITPSSGLSKLSANDYLILAGTFHGVHAIARSLCPVPNSSLPAPTAAASVFQSTTNNPPGGGPAVPTTGPGRRPAATGIEVLESSTFRLTVRQTATGTKFLLFTSPDTAVVAAEGTLRKMHELYALYVMGNPFYSLEMPIRVERFEREVGKVLGRAA